MHSGTHDELRAHLKTFLDVYTVAKHLEGRSVFELITEKPGFRAKATQA